MVRFPKLNWISKPIILNGIFIFGFYRYKDNTINIYREYKPMSKIYIIFHELLHSLFHQWGEIPELLLNEAIDGIDRRMWMKDRLKYRLIEITMLNPS